MRRIAHDDKTTVKGRRHGITPNILKKEIAKPCKVKAPLRSVNQGLLNLCYPSSCFVLN